MPSLSFLHTLIQVYNTDPKLFSEQYSYSTVECPGLTTKSLQALTFSPAESGSFWIVSDGEGTNWMLPKVGIPVNEYSYGSLSKVFNCYGYQPGINTRFNLRRPVLVSAVAEAEIPTFRIEQRGILEFDRATEQEQYLIKLECQLSDLQFSATTDPAAPTSIPDPSVFIDLEARLDAIQEEWKQEFNRRTEEIHQGVSRLVSQYVIKKLNEIEETVRDLTDNQSTLFNFLENLQSNQSELQNQVNQLQTSPSRQNSQINVDQLKELVSTLGNKFVESQEKIAETAETVETIQDNLQDLQSVYDQLNQQMQEMIVDLQTSQPNTPDPPEELSVAQSDAPVKLPQSETPAAPPPNLPPSYVEKLVQTYQEVGGQEQAFQKHYIIAVVKETSESVIARYRDQTHPLFFMLEPNGLFWVVAESSNSGWLVPKGDITVNEFTYRTLSLIFNCHNYAIGKHLELLTPARVYIANQGRHIELNQCGELRFS